MISTTTAPADQQLATPDHIYRPRDPGTEATAGHPSYDCVGSPIDRITDANVELNERATARLAAATAALCFLVGAFVSMFRRKDFIVLSICGWSRLARLLQIAGECAVLSIGPIAVTLAATQLVVADLAPRAALALALRVSILAASAATAGSSLPVIAHRSCNTLTTMRE